MVQQSPRRLELTVTADQAGEKIDTLLRRELRLSGTVIRRVKWLDDGILLDGTRVTTACRPAAGLVSFQIDSHIWDCCLDFSKGFRKYELRNPLARFSFRLKSGRIS